MKGVLFACEPVGAPTGANVAVTDTIAAPSAPATGNYAILSVVMVSVDPYMRGRMRVNEKSYMPPFTVGEPLDGSLVAVVEESTVPSLKTGSLVHGWGPWQEKILVLEGAAAGWRPVEDGMGPEEALSVCGGTGLTAYFGLLDVAGPITPGETVLVSGAAGGVGSVVVQIAKHRGLKVIGIAGTPEKCKFVTETLGADHAICYRGLSAQDLSREVERCAGGEGKINIYFDNVGGDQFDAAVSQMALKGRIVCCGCISQYNDTSVPTGPRPQGPIIAKRLRVQGMMITDFYSDFPMATKELAAMVREGKITMKNAVNVANGFEETGQAFGNLFVSGVQGKQLIKVRPF